MENKENNSAALISDMFEGLTGEDIEAVIMGWTDEAIKNDPELVASDEDRTLRVVAKGFSLMFKIVMYAAQHRDEYADLLDLFVDDAIELEHMMNPDEESKEEEQD